MSRCQGCSGTAPLYSNLQPVNFSTWTHNLTYKRPTSLLLNWILFSAGGCLLQNTAINVNNAASLLPFNWHILPLIVCITEDKRIQAHEAHLHNEGIWSWDQQQCSSQLSSPAHTALGCFFSWPEQKQTMLMIIMIKLQVIVKIATAKQILIKLVLYNK